MPSFACAVSGAPHGGLRLDRYVAENLRLLSRSQIKARGLGARVNGREARVSHPVRNGDRLELSWMEPDPANLVPEDIPLDIMYEDDRAVVVNKPQGMVVHPGAGNWRGTLANALYHRRLGLGGSPETGGLRPGIVHRLDKDTSGVMVAAYDDEALAFLAGQFKSGKAGKKYVAIVCGVPRERRGRVETFIARDPKNRKRFAVAGRGRAALTLYSVLRAWQRHSLVLLRPRTGRTHQLRVHMRHLGHPIVGDPIYGFSDPMFPGAGLMLHARSLAIVMPGGGFGERPPGECIFKAPLPRRFGEMIRRLDSCRLDN
ncbi:MAG: RluA family pseudouridine synthase [Treponema sp.]|nr:RluA family pseudouridine synthase [Treponema sp.]